MFVRTTYFKALRPVPPTRKCFTGSLAVDKVLYLTYTVKNVRGNGRFSRTGCYHAQFGTPRDLLGPRATKGLEKVPYMIYKFKNVCGNGRFARTGRYRIQFELLVNNIGGFWRVWECHVDFYRFLKDFGGFWSIFGEFWEAILEPVSRPRLLEIGKNFDFCSGL